MRKQHTVLLVLVLGVALVSMFVSTGYAQPSGQGPIKIGGINELATGWGTNIQKACEAITAYVNEQGGILGRKVQLTFANDEIKVDRVTSLARRYITDEGVVGLLGPSFSAGCVAISDIAAEYKVPQIGSGMAREFTQPVRPWSFNIIATTDIALRVMLQRCKDLGMKKIAYYYTDTTWGRDGLAILKEITPSYGLELADTRGTTIGQTEVTPLVMAMQKSGAEAVLQINYETEVAAYFRACTTLGWKPKTMNVIGPLSGVSRYLEPAVIEGMEAVDWFNAEGNKEWQKWWDIIKARRPDADPQQGMMWVGVDEYRFLLEGIRQSKTGKPSDIRDAMEKLRNFPATTGPVGWTHNFSPSDHQGMESAPMKIFTKGNFVTVK